MNNKNQYNYGPLTNAQKYSRARVALIIFFMLSFANVFFIMIGNFNFGLSSSIATYVTIYFKSLSANPLFYALGIIIGIICSLPLIVTYIMSKNKPNWILYSLYWVCLDSLVLVADFTMVMSQDPVGAMSYFADLAFHAWVVYTIVKGVKVRNNLDEDEE